MNKSGSEALQRFNEQLRAEYASRFPRSRAHLERYGKSLLDAVSHAVRWNDPFMPVVGVAKGAIIEDIDGIDIINTSDIAKNSILLTVSVDKCDICQTILSSGCFLKNACTKGDQIIWRFVSPKKEYVKKIDDSLDRLKIRHDLHRLQALDERGTLTQRQEQIIRIAYEQGYFDFPKKIGVRQIAQRTGISSSLVSETLRRATKKLIAQHFKYDD